MKKNAADIFLMLFMIAIPIVVLGAVTLYVIESYNGQKALMLKELSELGEFDPVQAEKTAAEKLGVSLPVAPSSKKPDEINKEIEKKIAELVREQFQTRPYSDKIIEITKKFNPVKKGDKVEFLLNRPNSPSIKGTFEGTEGVFVIVDETKYRVSDIMDEFRYLFDADIADKISRDKVYEFEKDYKEKKKKFADGNKIKIENELYTKYGYLKTDDGWTHAETLIKSAVDAGKKSFSAEKDQKKRQIYEKHRLFGIFAVSIDKEMGGSPKGKDGKNTESAEPSK